jgi:hypothetical protein
MTTDSDLLQDARRHGVELAARQPKLIHRIRLHWTGRRWGIKTAAGTPVAFADTAQALRDLPAPGIGDGRRDCFSKSYPPERSERRPRRPRHRPTRKD